MCLNNLKASFFLIFFSQSVRVNNKFIYYLRNEVNAHYYSKIETFKWLEYVNFFPPYSHVFTTNIQLLTQCQMLNATFAKSLKNLPLCDFLQNKIKKPIKLTKSVLNVCMMINKMLIPLTVQINTLHRAYFYGCKMTNKLTVSK